VFCADMKGDLSGLARPGASHPKIDARAQAIGMTWQPSANPVEFLSLTGATGQQLRATVSSFGPLLLARVLDLNGTQQSVLSLVFKFCDDKGLLLLDLPDLRQVLLYLSGEGASELTEYGGMSKATVGVLLRKVVELEQQGADRFFGEPEFDVDDLLRVDKLVFFFDEAHLLFDGASKAFQDQIEQVVRLIRSKGVGVFFVTQTPKDVPADVLAQLGNRIQHALRAFTPDDEKALQATARTFPGRRTTTFPGRSRRWEPARPW
ncbi:MAG: hypothetical protein H6R40_568, partial [Gemmatimonadetes bacterium]|nr:hypothetical protein [Gemmatimonadota bacterium]